MENRILFIRCLLVAAACHALLFGLFTFTIVPEPAPAKPEMSFLGSILHRTEVGIAEDPSRPVSLLEGASVTFQDIQMNRHATKNAKPLRKPDFSSQCGIPDKITKKSFLLNFADDIEKRRRQDIEDDSGSQKPAGTPPPFKPLKLRLYD